MTSNDKNISFNGNQTSRHKKPNKIRQRSESTCQFLCFRNCNDTNEQLQEDDVPNLTNLKINKVSLRKNVNQQQMHKFSKSISDKNLNYNKFRSQTSRSQNQLKQIMLFKKKAKIQSQIQKVDLEMSRLTFKYQKNINQLKAIKRQLQVLRNS